MSAGTRSGFRHNRGQAAVSVRARWRFVALALFKQTPVMAVLVGVPGLAAATEGERHLAGALLVPTVILCTLGILSRGVPVDADLRRIEAVATLALIFVLSTILAVPAFMVLGLNWLDAVFEAASGITTTGLSVARDAESWPIAGHFLRAWMQWCGGVVMAVAGVALLIDSSRAAQVLGKESVGEADYFASTRAKARLVLAGYGAITIVGVVISIPLFPGWWEGPMVALAAISTGGFTPRDSSIAEYSLAAKFFTLLLCVSTTVTVLFYAVAWKRGILEAFRRGAVPVTLGIIAGGMVLHALLFGLLNGLEDHRALIDSLLNHISAQTTAGFSATPVVPTSPLVLLMVAAMILGGDVGSTTGGIKTARVILLFRMIALVFLRLRLPERALSHLKVGDRRADAEAIVFAAALLAIYLVATLIFWTALFAAGHPALPSLFDAISALSGVGLSAGVIGPDLSDPLKAMAAFAMLMGRLEFFVLIALFLPSTWISRS